MLLNQQPITAETAKLVNLVTGYGLKIRLLNVRYNEVTGGGASRGSRETNGGEVYGGNAGSGRGGNGGYNTTPPDLPSRAGVDDDYYYSLFV